MVLALHISWPIRQKVSMNDMVMASNHMSSEN